MNLLFSSAPLGLTEWLLAALVGLIVIPIVNLEKRWRRRHARRNDIAVRPPSRTLRR